MEKPFRKYTNGAEFLYESGLFFEINRRILHPLGLSLELKEVNGELRINKLMLDLRDCPAGITYSEAELKENEKRIIDFMNSFGIEKMQERQNLLGYIVQKSIDEQKILSNSKKIAVIKSSKNIWEMRDERWD